MAKKLQQGDNVKFSPAVVKRAGGFASDMRGVILSIHPSGKTASVETFGTWPDEDGRSVRGIPLANLVHDAAITTARKANPAPRKRAAKKTAVITAYEMYGTRGEYAADVFYRGKLLKGFYGVDPAAIVGQAKTWAINQGYAEQRLINEIGSRLSNPAPKKRAISRPSQVTKKAPSKRLVARRKLAAKKPVKGYFPNPRKAEKLVTLQIEIDRGNGWEFYTNFQHGKSHVRAITEMAKDAAQHAAKMNPSWMVRVIKK